MRLIGKLIYLKASRPEISFTVGVLRTFMHQPREIHWITGLRILAYVKSFPEKKAMLVTREIRSPLLAIAHLLEEIW